VKVDFKNYRSMSLIIVIGTLWVLVSKGLEFAWGNEVLLGLGPVTIIGMLFYCYDRWRWKYPILKWLNKIPNLNGKYFGNIEYEREGKNQTKRCELIIKQTCSVIKVSTIFKKDGENNTESTSIDSFILADETGDMKLYFYYQNQGSCMSGDTLNQHDGMNVLKIIKDKKNIELKGYYFTNRDPQTKGCMEVSKVIKEKK
jgi:hypothetical protein